MTALRLYNTRTRQRDAFVPRDPARIGLYVCGPTVYDRAHIGNARPVVVFDVLYRLLRHHYGAEAVAYVRNITDIDDKIMARAKESGEAIETITARTIAWYQDDMAALGTLPPNHVPRATEYVGEMIAMTETLIAKGHAYAAEGHVLFAVASYPGYGALARRSLDDMVAGARVEVAPYKRDPMDFVLWKPSSPDQPGWDSPWGRGRPGWHIECSAMAKALLGEHFDIHAGGIDLAFPHHENEVAQSCCANGTDRMANFWLHNGFVTVEGEKMSKSLGNFFTVADLRGRGIPGDVMRLVLLSSHYRAPLDWTEARVAEAEKVLTRWYRATEGAEARAIPEAVLAALAADLNTPQAIAEMNALVGGRAGDPGALKAAMGLLGFPEAEAVAWYRPQDGAAHAEQLAPYLDAWQRLRKAKDFARADTLKAALEGAGLKLSVKPDGPHAEVLPGFDPAALPSLEKSG
ncbi:MAG: cysteine--tRNA ligase [Pseudomonadota bacterium]